MRLCSIRTDSGPRPAVHDPERGTVLTSELLGRETIDLIQHLARNELDEIADRFAGYHFASESAPVHFDALLREPGKVLGIGLNYQAHAGDLDENAPRTTPASFLKADHTIIGSGEEIVVPSGIGRVTSEAEMGLVFGRECYRVGAAEALSYLAGITPILDQTAEDVLRQNPRYLTRVKNYPTFLSIGPVLITMDEVLAACGDLGELTVSTVHNGTVHRSNPVADMIFSPAELVSFHSFVMPFHPGDVLLTGTPGAVGIVAGDEVSCRLGDGLASLTNRVVGEEPA